MWQEIKTSRQAIDALGGPAQVARLFADDTVTPGAVSMWRLRGLPAKAWLTLAPRLRRHGHFSPRLFDMLEPKRGGQDGGN